MGRQLRHSFIYVVTILVTITDVVNSLTS